MVDDHYAIITDMQPEYSKPTIGQEQLPLPPAPAGERLPVLPAPEGGIETGAERVEQTAEASAAVADATATGAPVVVSTAPVVDESATSTAGPAVAADDDVIEKDWVDKAKKIVLDTRDDPHGRSSKVNELQKDYLKKRYGKVLGANE